MSQYQSCRCQMSSTAPTRSHLHSCHGLIVVRLAASDEAHSAGSSPRNLSEAAGEGSCPLVQLFMHHVHARPLLLANADSPDAVLSLE